MKNAHKYFYMLMALAAGSLVAIGCNQSIESDASLATTTTNVSESGVVAKTDGGCCGKCATEQAAAGRTEGSCGKCAGESDAATTPKGCCGKCATEQAAAGQAEGCCGKCAGESDASTTSKGCCGKCEGESAVSKEADKTITCENGCNACAEGDSANCKCGDTPAAKPTQGKPDSESVEANEHVNSMPEDRDIFHFLLENHDKISRTVTELENGVETVTESTDAAIAAKIQDHVASMHKRIEDGRPLRMWDELYREIFKHADKIKMELKNTENGISVTETSDDEYVVKLIQEHAKVVSGFAKRGFEEARLNHEPPSNK